MAIATFVVGAYSGAYDGQQVGITDEGFSLEWEPKLQAIEKSDIYGDALLDLIYRGTNFFIQAELLEYAAAALAVAYPWSGVLGDQGLVGRLGSAVASAFVLTAIAGTTAAPATLTAPLAILAPGSNPKTAMTSRLRTLPVRMILLPEDDDGDTVNFTTT